jgi:VCBS repeat-containing protein
MRLRLLCLLSFVAASFVLGGCSSFKIVTPVDGSTNVTAPVNADITWNDSNMTAIHFTVDGADQTGAFTITNTATGGEAKSTLALQPGQHTVGASGTYKFIYTQNATALSTFKVSGPVVPTPTISSLTPNMGPKNTTVKITGTNFSANCADNTITFGTGSAVATGPCSSTVINFTVPAQASFGSNNVTVTVQNVKSAAAAFTVAREPGVFVEITSDIENHIASTQCSTGAAKLNICTGVNCSAPTFPFTASFTNSTGTAIGQPMGFHLNGTGTSGIGGAGFSLCTVGVVLDADTHTNGTSAQAMGIQFLDLSTKQLFPLGGYFFNYGAPNNASYVPRIFRSPDGTILIVATASTIGPSTLTAAVIDQANPSTPANTTCTATSATPAFSASITASNTVSISLSGTACNAITIH